MNLNDELEPAPGVGIRFIWVCFFALPLGLAFWYVLLQANPCKTYGDSYYKTTVEELDDYCTDGSEGNFKPIPEG